MSDSATLPRAYQGQDTAAKAIDAELASRYFQHVQIGDPAADALITVLQQHPRKQGQEWVQTAIDQGVCEIPDAPEEVRAFFEEAERVPEWFSPEKVLPGCRAFHRQSDLFLAAFVGAVLVEGFSTLISQSFSITGRLVDQGVRRLKQNNRQLLEIFLPGGLERQGDGWKLSLRIRLVHARVRHLLQDSEEWQADEWGTPLSSAHMAYAAAAFSALLIKRAEMLGAELNEEERESFMLVWRYSSYLMGIHHDLLFEDEKSALHLVEVGSTCEPPPTVESILLANGLINSAPSVAGIKNQKERAGLIRKIYTVSRALIGNELADKLQYPRYNTFGALGFFQGKSKLDQFLQKHFPKWQVKRHSNLFQLMMDVSHYETKGIRYRMPETVRAEADKPI